MAFLPRLSGGSNFPQVYAAQAGDGPHRKSVTFTDDIIFSHGKQGVFQAVVIASSKAVADLLVSATTGLDHISQGMLREDEVTVFIDQTSDPGFSASGGRDVYRFATGPEFASDPSLCKGRPDPIGYDPHRMRKEVGSNKIVILRPDRFVFALCSNRTELVDAAERLCVLAETGKLE